MQGQKITDSLQYKHLSMFLSHDCSWYNHVNVIKKKAWARLNMLRALTFKLDG